MSNVTLAFGDLPGLAPYATTERERSVLKAWQQAGSISAAAAVLGIGRNRVAIGHGMATKITVEAATS